MRSTWTIAGLGCTALVLAGCATTTAASQTPASTHSSAVTSSAPATSTPPAAGTPSDTAKMVCGPQIQGSVKQALSLATLAAPKPTWQNSQYSCVYQLPMGPMTLSVKQSANDAAADAYFAKIRSGFGKTETMIGLGKASYGTNDGIVVVVKDDKTLVVDTTKLPAVFGAQGQKRSDLAYEIASDVLGCWTGTDYGSTVAPG